MGTAASESVKAELPPRGERFPRMFRTREVEPPCRERRPPLRPRAVEIPGHWMARVWYHRLLDGHGPSGSMLAVLAVVVDLAGDTLHDVDVTRAQIELRLWNRRAGASAWGCGVDTVARALRALEAAGWIGITHAHIPSHPGKLMLRIRVHVPPHAEAAWRTILGNSQEYRKLRAREAAAARKAAAAAEQAQAPPAVAMPQGSSPAGEPNRQAATEALAELPDEPAPDVAQARRWAQRAIRHERRALAEVLTVIAQRWGADSRAGQEAAHQAQLEAGWREQREVREAAEHLRQQLEAEAEARQEAAQGARAARDGP